MNKKDLLESLIEDMKSKSREELIDELNQYDIKYTISKNKSFFTIRGTVVEGKSSIFVKSSEKKSSFFNILNGDIEKENIDTLISSDLYNEVNEFNLIEVA